MLQLDFYVMLGLDFLDKVQGTEVEETYLSSPVLTERCHVMHTWKETFFRKPQEGTNEMKTYLKNAKRFLKKVKTKDNPLKLIN